MWRLELSRKNNEDIILIYLRLNNDNYIRATEKFERGTKHMWSVLSTACGVNYGWRIEALVEHHEVCSEVSLHPQTIHEGKLSIMISRVRRNQTRLMSFYNNYSGLSLRKRHQAAWYKSIESVIVIRWIRLSTILRVHNVNFEDVLYTLILWAGRRRKLHLD